MIFFSKYPEKGNVTPTHTEGERGRMRKTRKRKISSDHHPLDPHQRKPIYRTIPSFYVFLLLKEMKETSPVAFDKKEDNLSPALPLPAPPPLLSFSCMRMHYSSFRPPLPCLTILGVLRGASHTLEKRENVMKKRAILYMDLTLHP